MVAMEANVTINSSTPEPTETSTMVKAARFFKALLPDEPDHDPKAEYIASVTQKNLQKPGLWRHCEPRSALALENHKNRSPAHAAPGKSAPGRLERSSRPAQPSAAAPANTLPMNRTRTKVSVQVG